MNKLENARERIDQIDAEIASLYEQRLDAVRDVVAYKKENSLPVLDSSREEAVIEKNRKRIANPDYVHMYERFIQFMMDQSKDFQKALISEDVIAYSGIEGSFAQMISQKLFEQNPKLAVNSFEKVFDAVLERKAKYGVIPFENTSSGLVGEVMDLLLEKPVYITEVADLKIDQCLLGLPEATLRDIRWVYSKDQALAQSKEFLEALEVETVPYPNTALAAQYVSREQDITKAAIGARENAPLYGLKVLASHIESTASNTTRFLVIAADPADLPGDHLSMILAVNNEAGSLARAIQVIGKHRLNMDCLQSRPIKDHPFQYFFYIQCEGDLSQENLFLLQEELKDHTYFMRYLGIYPVNRQDQ